MGKITVRFSDQEEADLKARAESVSLSVSELIRGTLFPGTLQNAPANPASPDQISGLAGQLASVARLVERLAAEREKFPVPKQKDAVPLPVSAPGKESRPDQFAEKMAALSDQVEELSRLILSQKNRPFGLDLPFLQATLMAVFALARGNFARYPEEWEPFKDEAWRRAFAPSEDT